MKILAHRIKRELNLGESTQCAVYEDELKRLWPLNHKEREAKIAPSLRRNTDSVSGFTARDCAQSSTSAATKATFVILSSQIMTLPATAPLLSWTIGIVLEGSKGCKRWKCSIQRKTCEKSWQFRAAALLGGLDRGVGRGRSLKSIPPPHTTTRRRLIATPQP